MGQTSLLALNMDNSNAVMTPTTLDTTGVFAGQSIMSMVAGKEHFMVLLDGGAVYGWGNNQVNQIGLAAGSASLHEIVPVQTDVTGALMGKTITKLAAGRYLTAFITDEGSNNLYLSGSMEEDGSQVPQATYAIPTQFTTTSAAVTDICIGKESYFFIRSEGTTLIGLGENGDGQLGDGTLTNSGSTPFTSGGTNVDTAGALNGVTVNQFSCGGAHVVVRTGTGSLVVWGRGDEGQLGLGNTADQGNPIAGPALTVSDVSAGSYHTVALDTSNVVRSWGQGTDGQLGNGASAASTTPLITTDTTWGSDVPTSVIAGYDNSWVITTAGDLHGWGNNNEGQLGVGTTTDTNLAQEIPAPVLGRTLLSVAVADLATAVLTHL